MTPRPPLLPELSTGAPKTDNVLRSWKLVLDRVLGCLLLRGALVSGKVPEFTPATVVLRHNLGRVPVGWFHVGQTDGTQLVRTTWDESTITFEQGTGAGVDTPFTLWIF